MFWAGRVNAVLAIIAVGGALFFFIADGPVTAFGFLLAMGILRVAIRIVDVIWTAATGNPLIYGTKILPPKHPKDNRHD